MEDTECDVLYLDFINEWNTQKRNALLWTWERSLEEQIQRTKCAILAHNNIILVYVNVWHCKHNDPRDKPEFIEAQGRMYSVQEKKLNSFVQFTMKKTRYFVV